MHSSGLRTVHSSSRLPSACWDMSARGVSAPVHAMSARWGVSEPVHAGIHPPAVNRMTDRQL